MNATEDDQPQPLGENPDVPHRTTDTDRYKLAIADLKDMAQRWVADEDKQRAWDGRVVLRVLAGYGL